MKKLERVFVHTTIELPHTLFSEVKSTAARQDKLAKTPNHAERPWMKIAGIAANNPEIVAELKRIEQIVNENFEGAWK